MKLLELIVKNVRREEIHHDAKFFVQDDDGTTAEFSDKPKRENGVWLPIFCVKSYEIIKLKAAEDASTTIITREELMRAYDLVEQGYTLWFGGECPVDDGVMVDIVYPCGEKESDIGDFYSWENSGCATDIIAYKIAGVKPDEQPIIIEKTSPNSPILCDLMRDISSSMPEMMAADMVELADYLISQGWGKHE